MDGTETVATEQPQQDAEVSIADHVAQFGPEAVQDANEAPKPESDEASPEPQTQADRDAAGRFQRTRHRAKSQQASPDDVDAINGYTKRIKEYEAKAGADIIQKTGESERAFSLRRRAELLERQQQAPKPQPQARLEPRNEPRADPVRAVEDLAPKDDDPKYKDDYGLYLDDRAAWRVREEWRNIRKQEVDEQKARSLAVAHEATAKSWAERVAAAKAEKPDYEAVAFAPTRIPPGSFVDAWIMEHKQGARVLYSLQKNPAEQDRILALPILEQAEELTLLAQRLNPQRQAAVVSGAAPAPRLANLPPRPPTPERTEAQRASDAPPLTDGSLSIAEHQKQFGPKSRR